ncbi:MAG: ABC transporter substrate-binding protein [Actinomycetaceae bacterium]|nr:ABC transporter substrate-binding protein [Actinomycetaceae bacterium]
MSKRTLLGIGALAMSLALGACGAGSAGDAGSEGKDTGGKDGAVNYVLPTSWANVEVFKENVAKFQEESGITVNVQAVPDENYNSVVGSRLAGGTDVDIFAGAYQLFDVPNVMIELTDEDFMKRMPEGPLNSLRHTDGKIYSFPSPSPGATFGVFYNKKALEKAGAAVPTSLDEMTDALKKLKAAEVTPLYLAGKDGWTLLQHRNAANPLMNLDGDTIGKLNKNELRWDEIPALTDQYTALEGWAKDGLLNDDVLTATYEQSQQALVDGSAGMIINGTWVIGELVALNESAKEDIGFFPLPAKDGRSMLGLSAVDGLHIAKTSKNVDNAKKFLSFLASAEVAQSFMDAAPGLSSFTDVTVPDNAPAAMKDVAKAAEGKTTLHIDNSSVIAAPESDLIASYQLLVSGKESAADFLKAEAEGMIAIGKQSGVAGF